MYSFNYLQLINNNSVQQDFLMQKTVMCQVLYSFRVVDGTKNLASACSLRIMHILLIPGTIITTRINTDFPKKYLLVPTTIIILNSFYQFEEI